LTPSVTIAVAVHQASSALPRYLTALEAQVRDGIEVLLCHPAGDGSDVGLLAKRPWLTPVAGATDALVPHLWRDGILRATAPRVALTTVDCLPGPGYVDALLAADLDRHAAVGGSISNASDSDARGWAVYLLRYLRYAPPFTPHETIDLPGDNVVYDRRILLTHRSAFVDGFWEPEVHAVLQRAGCRLLLDPSLTVVYANSYTFGDFMRQRFAHGRRFGFSRAVAMSPARRLGYFLLTPAVPLIFGAKIVRAAFRRHAARRHLTAASPYLSAFLMAWAAGEMSGALEAVWKLFAPRRASFV
jgi:hypothetical protein